MLILQSINAGFRIAILVFTCCMVYTVVFNFLNHYLVAPWPNLGYYWGDSLTHPMLITVFFIFDPKVTGSLVRRFGSLSPAEGLVGFEPATFRCLLLNGFTFSCCFHVFLKNFFMPRVDVNREGMGVQISNVESTLSVAQWVWMAPLTRGKTLKEECCMNHLLIERFLTSNYW